MGYTAHLKLDINTTTRRPKLPSDATQDPSAANGERTVPPFDALDPSLVAMNSTQAGEEIPT